VSWFSCKFGVGFILFSHFVHPFGRVNEVEGRGKSGKTLENGVGFEKRSKNGAQNEVEAS
jgi:hypothetical protein